MREKKKTKRKCTLIQSSFTEGFVRCLLGISKLSRERNFSRACPFFPPRKFLVLSLAFVSLILFILKLIIVEQDVW